MDSDTASADQPAKREVPWRLIVVALLATAIVVFVAQNGSRVEVTWLFFSTTGPLWVVIVVAAVTGAAMSEAITWAVRRCRRPARR